MVSLDEQETVIQYNRTDSYATIYTSDSTSMTRLDRLCKTAPEFYECLKVDHDRDGKVVGKFYKLVDKKMLSLRGKKRTFTEEQKKLAGERLRKTLNKPTT